MIKSILAVSEGGPDAAMSFRLAARVAGLFDAAVDALHLAIDPSRTNGSLAGDALPLVMNVILVGFELLVAFLQAYVFAILTSIYLHDAVHLH